MSKLHRLRLDQLIYPSLSYLVLRQSRHNRHCDQGLAIYERNYSKAQLLTAKDGGEESWGCRCLQMISLCLALATITDLEE